MERASVVIIGAGAVGTSIAYHLAKRGCADVVVLEKDAVGCGSTSKCAGGIRHQFSTEVNVRFSRESVRFFQDFEQQIGQPCDFRQNGYVILATSVEELNIFRENIALQQSMGVKVYLLSPEGVKDLVPVLNTSDVVAASYCPCDGFADPYQVVQGFASAARKLGVRIHEDTEVTGVRIQSGKVHGVDTSRGRFAADVVVVAAGPYAALAGGMAGIEVPVQPSRRHIFFTAPVSQIVPSAPMVIDFHTGFWFRRESQGLMIGMRNPLENHGFDTSVDWGFLPTLARVASHRLPLLENVGIVKGWAGLHEDTPDCHAIIGKAPGIDGLLLAVGFSGHGFMHSPATGKIVSELVLDGQTSIDISSLALERFSTRALATEKVFI